MAAVKNNPSTKLVLKVVTGTTTDGKALTKSRTFGNVNPALSDDDLLTVGTKIGNLQAHDVATMQRVDTSEISEAE